MRFPHRQDLTYANVMSTLAVFFALGGVSVAAVATDGSGGEGSGPQTSQEESSEPSDEGNGTDGDQEIPELPGDGDTGGGDDDDEDGDEDGDGDGDGDQNDDNGSDGSESDGDASDGDGDEQQPVGQLDSLTLVTREGEPVSTADVTGEAVGSASCEGAERVVGGGVRTTRDDREAQPVIMSSAPDGNSWSATVQNRSGLGEVTVRVYVVCATSGPAQE